MSHNDPSGVGGHHLLTLPVILRPHSLTRMGTEDAVTLLQAVLADLRAASEEDPPNVDSAALGRIANSVEMAIAALSD